MDSYDRVCNELNQLGYPFKSDDNDIRIRIENLMEYVGSELVVDYEHDPLISAMVKYRNKIIALRSGYSDLQREYETLNQQPGYNQELTQSNIDYMINFTVDLDSRAK